MLLSSKPLRRQLQSSSNILAVSTTAKFTLVSFLSLADVRRVLSGAMVSSLLAEGGYKITAKDPELINVSPTVSPTAIVVFPKSDPSKLQPNTATIAGVSVAVCAFVGILLGVVVYFHLKKKVI